MSQIKIGIIGGTGLNKIDIFHSQIEKSCITPFGETSDCLIEGFIDNVSCVMLNRHGRKHNINPTNINYRANLWALKDVGCTHILAVTSYGGLQNYTKPGDIVVLDQFFDNTRRRIGTFYDGCENSPSGVLHIPMDKPFCEKTRKILIDVIRQLGGRVHESGAVVTIEGPRFSSKFESKYWHGMGASVINMTTVPEVVLAKELGLCYASLAMVTDYDSWLDIEESVDVQQVKQVIKSNVEFISKVLVESVKKISNENWEDIFRQNKKLVESSLV